MRQAAIIVCILASFLLADAAHARSLQQAAAPGPSGSLRIPANKEAVESSRNATRLAEQILSRAGQVNEAGIQDVTLTGAHGAAETLYSTAPAGQSSAVHATVAATGAALLAAGAALTNNAAYIAQARSAISTANSLIAAVRDEDILRVSATEFANLDILTTLAHDGSLVHYWQNSTNGPKDNVTFADYVESAIGLYEVIEEQAAAGASNSIAILSARAIAYNLLGSVYVFQGNNSAVAQQNINIALTMLQAIRFKQTGTTCSAQWSTVDPLLEKAIASTTNATTALTDASLTTAITDSQAVLSAAQCSALAPSLAPAAAVSSAGRK